MSLVIRALESGFFVGRESPDKKSDILIRNKETMIYLEVIVSLEKLIDYIAINGFDPQDETHANAFVTTKIKKLLNSLEPTFGRKSR